jgi:hypothetical protein
MIRRNTPARVVQHAALAFFVRTRRAASRCTTGNAPTTVDIPHADPRYQSPNATWTVSLSNAMPNERAAVVFWRAPVYQRGPSPVKGFQSAAPRRRCAPLTGTNPRWCRAQMRQKTCGPPRWCTGGMGMTPIINLFMVRACCLIVRRPLKTGASRLRRALTGRHGYGYDVAHRARHHDMEELV